MNEALSALGSRLSADDAAAESRQPRAESSLVIQTAFLGDVILTTPLIRLLAQRGPVDVVTTPAAAPLLARNPAVRETIVFDKRGSARGLRGLARLARTLRERQYATAYLAQASMRSGALAMLARIPERVGFVAASGRRFYTRRVPYRDDLHHAERLLRLALPPDAEQVPHEMLRPELYPSADDEAVVTAALRDAELRAERLVALAPGSVWATKRWPYYPELAAQIAPTADVVIVGGPGEGALASEIVERVRTAGGRALDLTGRLSLLGSAALVRRSRALVTNDSAPLHLASATDAPTLAIFGPTVPAFGFGPLARRSAVAEERTLACRPCDRHGPQRCPLGHWRCMRELSPTVVASMLQDLLTNPEH